MDSKELTRQIGQRLRAERHALGLSLSQVSERTGATLSKSRISNYEQGIRRMGLEEARLLAEALGTVSPMYLLCLEDERELENVRRCFLGSDAEGRRQIVTMAGEIRASHPTA